MTPAPRTPAQIEPYVRALGVDRTITFLLAFGGAELYLAANPKGRSRLVEVLGQDGAQALADMAELLPRRVPTAKPWIAMIWLSKGLPVAEIARRLHVSDVAVRGWKRKAPFLGPRDSDQLSLF